MFDEMAIRQQIQWDCSSKRFEGVVNYGIDIIDKDCTIPATNAIVFLVNAVNGFWKVPVAYYFVTTLNASEKAAVLINILSAIRSTGVETISVTFDGARSNLSMINVLGGQITSSNNIKTDFPHPISKNPVFVFLDVAHMLKLIRNILGISIHILLF